MTSGSSVEFATIGGTDEQRAEPAWYFNKVSEAKRTKNRVHLDLIDPDVLAVAKLTALGATIVATHHMCSHQWTVMQDPEGNEFCVAVSPYTGRLG